MSETSKNIAIFIDGTGQSEKSAHASNVLKLYYDAKAQESDTQKVLYLPGVGTDADAVTRAAQTVTGSGSVVRIHLAYAFLCQNYQPGDHIYLFGFSRGAFAVRSLAGFVGCAGIAYLDDLETLKQRFAEYESALQRGASDEKQRIESKLRDEAHGNGIPVYFLGCWDTVVALDGTTADDHQNAPGHRFHDLEMPNTVTHARHALAAHEYRTRFEPVLFNTVSGSAWFGKPSLKQVWFAGDHSDVGGSHPTSDLSAVSLRWMADECRAPEGTAAAGHGNVGLKISFTPLTVGRHVGLQRIHRMLSPPGYAVRGHLLGERTTTDEALKSMSLHETLTDRLCDCRSEQEHVPGDTRMWVDPGSTRWLGRQSDEALVKFAVFLALRTDKHNDPNAFFRRPTAPEWLSDIGKSDCVNVTRLLDAWLPHLETDFKPGDEELKRCLLAGLVLLGNPFLVNLDTQVKAVLGLRDLIRSDNKLVFDDTSRSSWNEKLDQIVNATTDQDRYFGAIASPLLKRLRDDQNKRKQAATAARTQAMARRSPRVIFP